MSGFEAPTGGSGLGAAHVNLAELSSKRQQLLLSYLALEESKDAESEQILEDLIIEQEQLRKQREDDIAAALREQQLHADIKQDLDRVRSSIAQVELQMRALKQQYNESEGSSAVKNKQVLSLQNELDELRREDSQADVVISGLEDKISSIRSEVSTLLKELLDVQQEGDAECAKIQREAESASSASQKQAARTQSEIADLERQIRDASEEEQDMERRSRAIEADLQRTLADLEREKHENAALQEAVTDQLREADTTRERQERERAELVRQSTVAEETTVEQARELQEEAERDRVGSSARVAELEAKLKVAQALQADSASQLQSANSSHMEAQQQVGQLRMKVTQSLEHCAQKEAALTHEKAEIEELTATNRDLEKRIHELSGIRQNQLAEMRQRSLSEASQKRDAAVEKLRAVTREIEQIKQGAESLDSELRSEQAAVAKLRKENEALARRLDDLPVRKHQDGNDASVQELDAQIYPDDSASMVKGVRVAHHLNDRVAVIESEKQQLQDKVTELEAMLHDALSELKSKGSPEDSSAKTRSLRHSGSGNYGAGQEQRDEFVDSGVGNDETRDVFDSAPRGVGRTVSDRTEKRQLGPRVHLHSGRSADALRVDDDEEQVEFAADEWGSRPPTSDLRPASSQDLSATMKDMEEKLRQYDLSSRTEQPRRQPRPPKEKDDSCANQ